MVTRFFLCYSVCVQIPVQPSVRRIKFISYLVTPELPVTTEKCALEGFATKANAPKGQEVFVQAQTDITPHYLSLTDVAKVAPGRPSTNAVWRWCRRGVLSRDGERVRLKHVRVGGQIFTTAQWLDDFGSKLAESDALYFDLADAAQRARQAQRPRRSRAPSTFEQQRRAAIEAARRDLDAAGI